MKRCVLIVGCGYIGTMVARREIGSGATVHAFVKSEQSADEHKKNGIDVQTLDLDAELKSLNLLSTSYDVIYYFLAPQTSGFQDLRVQQFLSLLSETTSVSKFVLISTTGVYGDCSGDWLDETRVLSPVAARAHRRVSAEQQCIVWAKCLGVEIVILRVGGIYGEGKLPLNRLNRGDPVLAIVESPWSNRIYAKDLVEVCIRATRSGVKGVLNVVDGSPSTMTEYFLKVADFAGIKPPKQITMEGAKRQLGEGILSYFAESRRIGNRRLIEELGADCVRFPSLDQGLADIKLSRLS